VLGGGGSRHPAWRQLLADVLGLPLYPARTTWLSATGAAMLAAAAVTGDPAAISPPALTSPITPVAPPTTVSTAYGRYLTLRRTAGSAGTAPDR
jgi:xylulokinase